MHQSKLLDEKLGEIELVHIHTPYTINIYFDNDLPPYFYFSHVIFLHVF